MEVNRRPRIVKRAPLWRRIISAPEDYLTKLENDIRALDWDMLQEGFRYCTVAIALTLSACGNEWFTYATILCVIAGPWHLD